MTAMPVADRITAEQYLAGPYPPNRRPRNLVDGEVVVNEPSELHGALVRDLLYAIETWVRAGAGRGTILPPVDVMLDERNVFAPDLLWYSEGNAPARGEPPPYRLPDLAIEIRSPSTWAYDIGAKKAAYERHGLLELWLVDTAADELLVFRRSRPQAPAFDVAIELTAGDALSSPLLPGFALSLGELFAN